MPLVLDVQVVPNATGLELDHLNHKTRAILTLLKFERLNKINSQTTQGKRKGTFCMELLDWILKYFTSEDLPPYLQAWLHARDVFRFFYDIVVTNYFLEYSTLFRSLEYSLHSQNVLYSSRVFDTFLYSPYKLQYIEDKSRKSQIYISS